MWQRIQDGLQQMGCSREVLSLTLPAGSSQLQGLKTLPEMTQDCGLLRRIRLKVRIQAKAKGQGFKTLRL